MTNENEDKTRHRTSVLVSASTAVIIISIITVQGIQGQFQWQQRDAVDEIQIRMDRASRESCPVLHLGDLYLPEDTLSHLPEIKDININPVFPNRTALLHLHNLALSRSFFWSYILQSRFIRPAINDTYDPGKFVFVLDSLIILMVRQIIRYNIFLMIQ